MNLHEGLHLVADYLLLDDVRLIDYAEQDQIGGWDYDAYKHNWPCGSIFGIEGQILYALAREYRPEQVVMMSIMTGGCALSHIAAGLLETAGRVVCVDSERNAAYLTRAEYAPVIDFAVIYGIEYLRSAPDSSIDILFDDLPKSIDTGAEIARQAQRVLRPGGLLIVHDAAHFLVGATIQEGLRRGGINDHLTVKIDDTDCGLAIWKKPGAPKPPVLFDKNHPSTALESQESGVNYAPDYAEWTVVDLQTELDRRGIEYKGRDKKDILIAKLEGDNEAAD